MKLLTYNVLAPRLGRQSQFPTCRPEDLNPLERFPKIRRRLEESVREGRIIALQEVDLEWAGKLHALFAENGYSVVFAQYGSAFSGYMGVMLAWPIHEYEVVDVEICKVSDTAAKELWPKEVRRAPEHYGFLTGLELYKELGVKVPKSEYHFDEWDTARKRQNEAVLARFRHRQSEQPFVVSTYHMPCMFGSPAKRRIVHIHTRLLLNRLSAFAKGDPIVLMGDFNVKPSEACYCLAQSGGDVAAPAERWPEDMNAMVERMPRGPAVEGGMESAYAAFHGREPEFTNFVKTAGQADFFCECLDYIWFSSKRFRVTACPGLPQTREASGGPFPSAGEPSDHLPLYATLRLQ